MNGRPEYKEKRSILEKNVKTRPAPGQRGVGGHIIWRQSIETQFIAVRMRNTFRRGNMVADMANEQQHFETLIAQLMSPDNALRNHAEVGELSSLLG